MTVNTFAEAGGFAEEETQAQGMENEDGDGLVVDLGGVSEKGNYKLLPRGIHNCFVASLDYSRSQRSNNPMWTWVFEVEEGNEGAGAKLFYHTVFNEGGMPRVKRTLARVQTDDGYPQQLLNAPFNPQKVAEEGRLLGARCCVKVDFRTYEGNKQNDVKEILPPKAAGGVGGAATFAGA